MKSALSPEWDRGFDETFTEIITGDDELLRAEFDDLVASSWQQSPPPPASSTGETPPSRSSGDAPENDGHPDVERSGDPPPPPN